jgi:hypothetical protein
MAWIELHQSAFSHRKTLHVADALEMQEAHVVGHLSALWCWCLDNAPDGLLPESRRIIARGAMWIGDPECFVNALLAAEFIRIDNAGRMEIANWSEYGGKLAERRRENAAKQARYRERLKGGTDTSPSPNQNVTVTSPSRNLLEKRREEKRTEQETRSSSEDAPEKKPPRSKPSRMVPDWEPNPVPYDKFPFSSTELNRQLDLFRDHFLSNGEAKADWNAAWRNWLRRAPTFDRKPAVLNGARDKFTRSGQKLLTSADLRRMALGESDEEQRDPSLVVDSQFRVAEPAHH